MSTLDSKRKHSASQKVSKYPDLTSLKSDRTSKYRNRGGQPGNTNALKHGFYSRRFRDIEFSDLDVITVADLQNEIAMMRVLMHPEPHDRWKNEYSQIQCA